MKKIISLILTTLMLLTFVPTSFASYIDTNDKSVSLVSALGLMEGYDDGTFLPENNITRAEFAQIIANMYKEENSDGSKEWNEIFFKDKEEEKSLITVYGDTAEPRFWDVDSAHWAYNAVNTVYNLGYMEGVSANEFAPDDALTAPQIYKILSVMLGYRVKAVIKGGYPSGYIAIANEIGLSDGITTLDRVSRADVARILTNAFDVKMLYLDSIGDKESYAYYEDKTFLTEIMGLDKVEGIMTDNGITSLSGASYGIKEEVIVNNLKVRLTEDTGYIRDFIGRNIDLYYRPDNNAGANYAVYAALNGKENVVTFDAADFLGADVNSITYEVKDKPKTVALKNGAPLIKNGMAVKVPITADFYVNKGTYTLVSTSGSNVYDLVVLDSYTSFYVDAVDSTGKKVYSKSTLVAGKTLDFSNENKTYIIYDDKGAVSNFSAITQGGVLSVSDSDEIMKVYISKKMVADAVISEKSTKNGSTTVSVGKTSYTVSKDFIDLEGDILEVGKKYILYLDKFGEIVTAASATESGILAAIMVDIRNFSSLENDYQLKYFTETGVMMTSKIASKVTFVNSDGENLIKNLDYLVSELAEYKELFRYKLNEDKEVSYIEVAQNQNPNGDNPQNRLLRIELENGTNPHEYATTLGALPTSIINGKVVVDSTLTKVFICPSDYTLENSFSISKIGSVLVESDTDNSSLNKDQYLGYTIEGDAPFANYFIAKKDSVQKFSATNKNIAIVKNIKKGLDPLGNPKNIITVYEKGSATETLLYCEDGVLNDVRDVWGRTHSDYDEATGTWTTDAQKYEIEMGDIIRYSTSVKDGSLEVIQIIFDENAINPHSKGQGNLAGSYGFYDANLVAGQNGVIGDYKTNSNPHAMATGASYDFYDDFNTSAEADAAIKGKFNTPMKWRSGEYESMLVYPVSTTNNSIKVTTKDLSVVGNEPDSATTDNYKVEVYKRTTALVLYVIDGGNLYSVSISPNELKTYELAGNDCDRMYIVNRWGGNNYMIPIRGKTTK